VTRRGYGFVNMWNPDEVGYFSGVCACFSVVKYIQFFFSQSIVAVLCLNNVRLADGQRMDVRFKPLTLSNPNSTA